MKHLLLPTDFSNNAWNALIYATQLFENKHATLHLLNAYKNNTTLADEARVTKNIELFEDEDKRSLRKLNEWSDQVRSKIEVSKHKIRVVSFSGTLKESIVYMSNYIDFDYIIMGTKGATGAKEVFLGSNTVSVAKHIGHIPIIAIPDNYEFRRPQKMIFATAFKHPYTANNISPLLFLIDIYNMNLNVLNIETDNKSLDEPAIKNKKKLSELLLGIDMNFSSIKSLLNISETIMSYAKDSNVDMITLIHKKHGFLERLFREPVVKKVAFYTEVPLLILPENDKRS